MHEIVELFIQVSYNISTWKGKKNIRKLFNVFCVFCLYLSCTFKKLLSVCKSHQAEGASFGIFEHVMLICNFLLLLMGWRVNSYYGCIF